MTSSDWAETASATAGAATASRAGVSGKRHSVTAITAGYVHASQTGTLTVKRGTTTVMVVSVPPGGVHLPLPFPLRGESGELVSASLSAGAAGVVGNANILGYTIG